MLRRSLRLAVVALAIFALAACEISVGPITFPPVLSGTETAQVTNQPTALRSVQIAPVTTHYYRINLPGEERDLLYGEVVGSGLRVAWLSTTGATLAVSESPAFFAGSEGALRTVAAVDMQDAVAPSKVVTSFSCNGPCAAIAPKASGYYYLAVRNISSQQQSFDLYAYAIFANDAEDSEGKSNDTKANATPFDAGENLQGAIELVGDRDWFHYVGSSNRTLTFTVPVGSEAVGLRLRFEDGTELTGLPGSQTSALFQSDYFQVYSVLGRAGTSSRALYTIEID